MCFLGETERDNVFDVVHLAGAEHAVGCHQHGALLASPKALPLFADGRFFEVGCAQSFLNYGLWQDYGTGRWFTITIPASLRFT